MDADIDLTVLNSEKIKTVCADLCGAKCCKQVGTKFQVPVSISDYKKLVDEGLDQQVNWDGKFPQLKTRDDGSCVFLTRNNTCGIYEVRPKACSMYPFRNIKSIIEDFCLLYHNSTQEYRQKERTRAEDNLISTTASLFDLEEEPYFSKYMSNLNGLEE